MSENPLSHFFFFSTGAYGLFLIGLFLFLFVSLPSFFFQSINLSLSIKPWRSLFSFPPFFFNHSHVLSTSIHPPYRLTGRVCCFYPTDIGSLPRARPGTSDGSPGSCPPYRLVELRPIPCTRRHSWGNPHAHTLPNTPFAHCARRRRPRQQLT